MTLEAIVKDKGDIFEKPLNMNIHYSQTLVYKNFFFENHLHTLTKLPFYFGPKDMEDPVQHLKDDENYEHALNSKLDLRI